jgi:hypothetical protein
LHRSLIVAHAFRFVFQLQLLSYIVAGEEAILSHASADPADFDSASAEELELADCSEEDQQLLLQQECAPCATVSTHKKKQKRRQSVRFHPTTVETPDLARAGSDKSMKALMVSAAAAAVLLALFTVMCIHTLHVYVAVDVRQPRGRCLFSNYIQQLSVHFAELTDRTVLCKDVPAHTHIHEHCL